MAAYDVLRDIVRSGSDLTLTHGIDYQVLRELASLAKTSGARLTVTTTMDYGVIKELSSRYGKSIAFIDGLDDFKK